jgi:hypothetical protein
VIVKENDGGGPQEALELQEALEFPLKILEAAAKVEKS